MLNPRLPVVAKTLTVLKESRPATRLIPCPCNLGRYATPHLDHTVDPSPFNAGHDESQITGFEPPRVDHDGPSDR